MCGVEFIGIEPHKSCSIVSLFLQIFNAFGRPYFGIGLQIRFTSKKAIAISYQLIILSAGFIN